jgi:hypothetical protein
MDFTMLYDWFGSLEGDHVGLAHSTEGARWEKYNDLATSGVVEESVTGFGPDRTVTSMLCGVRVGRLGATPADWVRSTWVFLPAVDHPGSAWLPAPDWMN